MSNPEYQSLIRCTGEEASGRLILPASDPHGVAKAIEDIPDDDLPGLLADLGGHDIVELTEAFAQAKANPDAPTVVFAYTIKGWGLPIAGHPMNHSALLTDEQIVELREELGVAEGAEWDRFPEDSIEGRLCRASAERLARHRRADPGARWSPPTRSRPRSGCATCRRAPPRRRSAAC